MKNKMKNNLEPELLSFVEQFVMGAFRLRQETRHCYRQTLFTFLTYLKTISQPKSCLLATIDQRTIVRYLKELRIAHSLKTVLPRARIITRFLSFLRKSGYLRENPLAQLKKEYPRKGLKGIVVALTGPSSQKDLQSLKAPLRFASPLGPSMQKFITLHRSQGSVYRAEECILSRFDRFLRSYSNPPRQLSDSILRKWLDLFSISRPEHRYKNFVVIRRFCLYLRRFDPKVYVPDSFFSPSPPSPFLPYIYSRGEIAALLKEAKRLKSSIYSPRRGEMFYFLIALLYTTGMRLSEVLNLKLGDIDWKGKALLIRETKFFKSRLVPLSSSTMRQMEKYLQLRQGSGLPTHPESLIFQNLHRKGPYSKSAIEGPFREMLRCLGLRPPRGRRGPRLHDLRHSFAVHRLEEWYRRGEDIQSKLGLLSTYLGHANIASTQRYLTMTTEVLEHASKRFNQYFISI